MDIDPQNRALIGAHETPDLEELLGLIRAGHAEAGRRLHHLLLPGLRFLLRRRLGRNDVHGEAHSVLDAAIQTIQADVLLQSDGVLRMVRRLIQQRYPAQTRPAAEAGAWQGQTVVEGLLDGMSSIEREALRRCYVLGEAPHSFLRRLSLTPHEFDAIRARARAEFSSRKAKANVA